MTQLTLDIYQAEKKRDEGIERATRHAEAVEPGWNEKAYDLLREFLNVHSGEFMTEQIRSYAAVVDFHLPPNARAWGGIIKKANYDGLIKFVRMDKTSNSKSHRTPANVWIKS